MKNKRTSIPTKVVEEVLHTSNMTCCVCKKEKKDVQIHHIDLDKNNNNIENLATLCPDCHNKAHQTGGNTRNLTPRRVKKFKDEWHKICEEKIQHSISRKSSSYNKTTLSEPDPIPYFKSLLIQKQKLLKKLEESKRGTTIDIIKANVEYIDQLINILITVAAFHPLECFQDKSPQEYFSQILNSRQQFYSLLAETYKEGSIYPIILQRHMINDIEHIIKQMVDTLWMERYDEYKNWEKQWHNWEI